MYSSWLWCAKWLGGIFARIVYDLYHEHLRTFQAFNWKIFNADFSLIEALINIANQLLEGVFMLMPESDSFFAFSLQKLEAWEPLIISHKGEIS